MLTSIESGNGWLLAVDLLTLQDGKTHPAYAGISRTTVTQYPRMMPFLKPQSLHMSLTTARKRLSPGEPYWPCMRTLNISTTKPSQLLPSVRVVHVRVSPGLARIAFAAPAIAPAKAISLRESWGKGEMMRFETPYAAKSSEFTPAIPINGLAMPARMMHF